MVRTAFARSIDPFVALEPVRPSEPAIGDDWSVLGTWTVDRPSIQSWSIGLQLDATVDPGTIGELQLRVGERRSNAAVIDRHVERIQLGWSRLEDFEWISERLTIHLEGRRASGATGGIRVLRAAGTLMSNPPPSQEGGPNYPAGYTAPYTAPIPPPPTDPTTPAPIDGSRLLTNIFATDVTTWGQNRTDGQLIIGGDRFNYGIQVGNIRGLTFNGQGDRIDSFQMQDGAVSRYFDGTAGPTSTTVIEGAVQWVNDGSYDESQEVAGLNPSVLTPPSDYLFFDGSRIQMALLDTRMSVGPTAETVRYCSAFIVEPWMAADDFTAGPHELHAPGSGGYTSPISCQFRNNIINIFSKDSANPLVINVDPNPPNSTLLAAMALPAVGEWFVFAMEYRVDPAGAGYPGGGSGFLNAYTIDETTGAIVQTVARGADWGYIFTTQIDNDNFYPMGFQLYQFHRFTPNQTTAPNNWQAIGPVPGSGSVRRLKIPFVAITQDPTVTIQELANHARYHIAL